MDKNEQIKLKRFMRELYLTTAAGEYAELAVKARNESYSYEQYLLSVVESEYEARRIRRIRRYLQESRLPLEKTLQSFELKRLPNKVLQQFSGLKFGGFLEHKENVLIFGNPGSGKTHLACALAQELINQSKKIYFSGCALLLQELLLAKRELKLPRLLKKLGSFEAIIIDDIGYVQQNKEEMEVLFTLLAERYERGSVIITSNLPFSKWERIFKDPMMTAAAVDRIIHHSVILELNIPSYRINHAQNKKTQKGG